MLQLTRKLANLVANQLMLGEWDFSDTCSAHNANTGILQTNAVILKISLAEVLRQPATSLAPNNAG